MLRLPRASAPKGDDDGVRKAIAVVVKPERDLTKLTGTFLPPGFKDDPQFERPAAIPISIEIVDDKLVFIGEETQDAAFYGWLRKMVLTQGEWLAQKTGVPALGWLGDIQRPDESPKLADIVKVYLKKPNLSPEEGRRTLRFWNEFTKIVGVTTVGEIRHAQVERYEAKINETDLGPKSIKHRYSRVKTVLSYALKRGRNPEHCRKALDTLAMLEVETPDSLDPNPIKPSEFWAIHKAATDAGDDMFAAMMLFSLNAALYPSEAGDVRWSDIDLERGEFVTRRRKTSVPRIAVLWPETIEALKKLPQERETVFNTPRTNYKRFSNFRDWKIYRDSVKLPDVKFNQIRDAAFTAACRVSLDQARVLAGHRMPGAVDAYVLRQPQFVAQACEGIRQTFMPALPPLKLATQAA